MNGGMGRQTHLAEKFDGWPNGTDICEAKG